MIAKPGGNIYFTSTEGKESLRVKCPANKRKLLPTIMKKKNEEKRYSSERAHRNC